MARKAADILVDALCDWGVDTIFGLPGDGINGIMEALRQRQDRIRFIHVCHEGSAAFMACGYAKFTGRLGCCLATSGPGGIHLLSGLYDAKMDGQPVLAITGLQYHDLVGTLTQQDVALDRLFSDVAVFSERVMGAAHVRNLTDLACRTALAYRGVAHLTVPLDLQEQTIEQDERSKRNQHDFSSEGRTRGKRVPLQDDMERAARILNEGRRVAILAGQGALHAGAELEQVAEQLGAPIMKALLGKCSVPDASPYTTGGIGHLGTRPSQEAMENCDTLLIAGSSFPYNEYYPKPGQANCVQIDVNPIRIGLRYPVDAGLVGDTQGTLRALLPLLRRKEDRSFLEKAQSGMKDWNSGLQAQASAMDNPMKPQVVAAAIGERLPENAILTCDSGTVTIWWARYIPAKKGQMHSVSGNLASMACALPYAIAAQLAWPDRMVTAFVGDGGLLMGMGELATCVKYNLPIKIVVLKNNTLGQIKWEQLFLGNPEYGCDLQPVDFAGVARACGISGYVIDDPTRCGAILDQAFRTEGPVLVEAVVDTQAMPLPPKMTSEQTANLAEAVAKGTPDSGRLIRNMVGDKIRELV